MGEAANGEGTPAEASAGPATLRDFVVANFPLLTAVGVFLSSRHRSSPSNGNRP